MITLYGIKNCDTVKKAKRWLTENHIEYHFHDFTVDGLSADSVSRWVAELSWETLLNKRSTTWKQLDSHTKENMNEETAQITILAHPTLIKRPLLDTEDTRHVGFKPETYARIFSRKLP